MGSSPSALAALEPGQEGLVAVKKMTKAHGGIPILGRYTTQKSLHSDYKFEMSWNAPKVIGTGMNGPVRLATGKDGKQYAVKSFTKKGMTPRQREELKNEVEIYLSLDHPHVARLEDVYETEEEVHLVMEYMVGGELYERLTKKKMFMEEAAADAAYQMLLAVAYLHSRNICHRDLKLENFLYEEKGSEHLKLIDFGFAKIFTSSAMQDTCGSLHYVAPEVLKKSYTSQADMWSIGVVAHMLLTGSPVYRGEDHEVIIDARRGRTRLSSRFGNLSSVAQSFVQSLLVVDPAKRLTAKAALEHPFVTHRSSSSRVAGIGVDADLLGSFQNYASASRFRRACLSMMAWSLSMEDRRSLRDQFLELDVLKTGTVSLPVFKAALRENCQVNGADAEQLFAVLDTDHDNELCYSEFLAAAIDDPVRMHEHVLRRTFARFDRDEAGVITVENLHTILGDTFEDVDVTELISEVDTTGDGYISYDQFQQCLQEPDSYGVASELSQPRISRSRRAMGQHKRDSLAGGLMDLDVGQEAVMPVMQKSPAWNKMDRAPFHNSLMRAAAEAAASCVRLPK